MSSNKGLTLLELLVAVALIGILSGVLYSSYFTVNRARDRAALGMEARREVATTLDLIRREVAASVFSRDDKTLRFVVEDRDNFGKPASTLELTTGAAVADGSRPESGTYNVQYRLFEKDKRFMLTRSEQDTLMTSAKRIAYPQVEIVQGFLVECYDGSKWVRSWDTQLNGARPKLIRLTIQVEEDGRTVEFSALARPRVSGP
jgi:general secretion pathway protein J